MIFSMKSQVFLNEKRKHQTPCFDMILVSKQGVLFLSGNGDEMRRKRRSKRYRLIVREVLVGIMVLFLILAMVVLYNYYLEDNAIDQGFLRDAVTETGEAAGDWKLILVNRWHPIPDDYEVTLTELRNGQAVDSRIYPDLQEMFDDARAEGLMPKISSSYRTAEEQQAIMDEKIVDYQAEGNDDETARELAEKWVAIPGTSEHQLGIAVDITSENSFIQDASIIWQWLNENSWKYGFIQRYPDGKTDITGVIYESWHYRYVGREAAKEIYEQGICLEEYLNEVN